MPTVKHLSYAGITLPLATPELEEWLKRVHPQKTFIDWEGWNFDNDTEGLPTPPLPQQPPFQLGVLHWPTGASCPAWFHAVVTTSILNLIRSAVGDLVMTPKPLVMYDGRSDKEITASMYLLPPRPLNQLGHESSDLWLITLTDQRFYWPWKRGVISSQPASWSALYASLATILGISLSVETVNSSYGSPSRKWIGYYRPTPAILDAVATQVGQRIVVELDGTVKTVNWVTAKLASQNYIADNDSPISGGQLDYEDIARYVPESVDVLFASGNSTTGQFFASSNCCSNISAPYVISKYLGILGLSASGYSDASGVADTNTVIFSDLVFDGTNTTAAANYATQAAQDWYGWRLQNPDIVYPGIEPWVPSGWEDYIEWTMQKLEDQPFASTLVRREPWNDFPAGNWGAGLVAQTTTATGVTDVSCGWLAGLATGECLQLSFISAFGRCSTLDITQTTELTWASGNDKWCSSASAITYPGPGSPGQACFWFDDCTPKFTIDGYCLMYMGCSDGGALFSGGSTSLCSGVSVECNNYLLAKLDCVQCCTSIDGWSGPAWYCVRNTEECIAYVAIINPYSITGVGNVVEFYLDAELIYSYTVPGGGFSYPGVILQRTDGTITERTGFFDPTNMTIDLGLNYPTTLPNPRVWTVLDSALLTNGSHTLTINIVDNGAGNPDCDAEFAIVRVAFDGTQWNYDGVLLDLFVINSNSDTIFDTFNIGEVGCEAVELIDEDRCNDCIEICSGPYATQQDAEEFCPECIEPLACASAPLLVYGTPYIVKLCSGGSHWIQLPFQGTNLEAARIEISSDTVGSEASGLYWLGICSLLTPSGSFPSQDTPFCTNYTSGGTVTNVYVQLTLVAEVTYTITAYQGAC